MNCSVLSAIPSASVDKAIAANPGFVMAHVLKGYLFGLATEPRRRLLRRLPTRRRYRLAARRARRRMSQPSASWRKAAGTRRAGCSKTSPSTDPRDALALQTGHQIDFFTGDARMLRDRIARALPAWSASMPGYHAMLGMHAFGLEEMGDYVRAERVGRSAVEIEPRDGWAQHAVAHVMEMQSRQQDGIAWMRANPDAWTKESFLQVHNWWHLALFHFDLGQIDEVLKLYDGPIYGTPSTVALNMVDASAILWRLHLGGVDVGDRWAAIAANWAPMAGAGNYAFNDAHAMMAFVGAGLAEPARTLIETQQAAMQRRRRQCRLHQGCRPPRDAGDPGVRRRQLPRDGAAAEADPGDRPPLRRQPRPARRHRPDADRGGAARRRRRAVARARRRAFRRAAGKPAVAAVREPGGGG